jgi:PHS family inorganic phosphate transporter-like MFS transporter
VSAVIAAVSNLSTAYNLANISLVLVLLNANGFHATPIQKSALSSSVFAGAILGQLSFGYIGDCLGRGPAMRLTMALSILGSLASALVLSPDHNSGWVFTQLSWCRFFMGIGVGGVYPLSATVAAESSGSAKSRGRNTSLVFSTQGVGQCLVPLVTFVAWHAIAFRNGAGPGGNLAWRFVLGFGAIPGIILAPFKASETKKQRPNRESISNTKKSPDSLGRIIWETRDVVVPQLIGTAGTWFLFDVTFYANALFAPAVLAALFSIPAPLSNHGYVNITPSPTPYSFSLPHSAGIDSSIVNTMVLFGIGLPGKISS